MIFYFSGTGNSEFAAKRIGELSGDGICDLRPMIREGTGIDGTEKEEPVVFVMPVYGWRMPRVAEALIRRSEFTEGTSAYFVLTCGSEMGNAAAYARKLCADKGLKYMGCGELVMPENYIAMFDAPREEEARQIVKAAVPLMDIYAGLISEGKSFPEKTIGIVDRIKSTIVNPIFCRFIVGDKKFHADDRCTGCGRCETACPVGDIKIVDGRPEWQGRCIHCMDCITGCPEEAIEYGGISTGKPRYRCPDV